LKKALRATSSTHKKEPNTDKRTYIEETVRTWGFLRAALGKEEGNEPGEEITSKKPSGNIRRSVP